MKYAVMALEAVMIVGMGALVAVAAIFIVPAVIIARLCCFADWTAQVGKHGK